MAIRLLGSGLGRVSLGLGFHSQEILFSRIFPGQNYLYPQQQSITKFTVNKSRYV